jgi:hypothetical protein
MFTRQEFPSLNSPTQNVCKMGITPASRYFEPHCIIEEFIFSLNTVSIFGQ